MTIVSNLRFGTNSSKREQVTVTIGYSRQSWLQNASEASTTVRSEKMSVKVAVIRPSADPSSKQEVPRHRRCQICRAISDHGGVGTFRVPRVRSNTIECLSLPAALEAHGAILLCWSSGNTAWCLFLKSRGTCFCRVTNRARRNDHDGEYVRHLVGDSAAVCPVRSAEAGV